MHLKRTVVTVVVVLAALASVPLAPSVAAADDFCTRNPTHVRCQITTQTPTPADDADDGGSGSNGPSIPVDYEYFFNSDGTTEGLDPAEDQGCWGIRTVAEGEGVSFAEAQAQQSQYGENGALWDNCEITDTIDPAELATLIWRTTVRPPPPTPLRVQPGRAVTGLRAYLEIGGDVPAEQTIATPLGPATFTMTPRYVITWGDGASAESDGQGVPWPGGPGEISHVYTEAGGVTVTVQAFWSASWALAGQQGQLGELAVPTEGSLDLPVEGYQVRTD